MLFKILSGLGNFWAAVEAWTSKSVRLCLNSTVLGNNFRLLHKYKSVLSVFGKFLPPLKHSCVYELLFHHKYERVLHLEVMNCNGVPGVGFGLSNDRVRHLWFILFSEEDDNHFTPGKLKIHRQTDLQLYMGDWKYWFQVWLKLPNMLNIYEIKIILFSTISVWECIIRSS